MGCVNGIIAFTLSDTDVSADVHTYILLLLLFILDQSWASSVKIMSVIRWKIIDVDYDCTADMFSNITAVETGPSSAPQVAQLCEWFYSHNPRMHTAKHSTDAKSPLKHSTAVFLTLCMFHALHFALFVFLDFYSMFIYFSGITRDFGTRAKAVSWVWCQLSKILGGSDLRTKATVSICSPPS